MFKKEFIDTFSTVMAFSVLLLFCTIQSAAAIETPSEAEENSPVTAAEVTSEADMNWEYVFDDRADPFLPFIEQSVATTNIPDQEEVSLSGMQLFEPGQLTLVAIMFSSKGRVAMVEDVTGKGYMLNEGMLIGRYGVVRQIDLNQVNIIETRSVAGQDVENSVIMRLNKEGDQ